MTIDIEVLRGMLKTKDGCHLLLKSELRQLLDTYAAAQPKIITRPSPDTITDALREIKEVLRACEEGEIPIAHAMDTIHDLSDMCDGNKMLDVLLERAREAK